YPTQEITNLLVTSALNSSNFSRAAEIFNLLPNPSPDHPAVRTPHRTAHLYTTMIRAAQLHGAKEAEAKWRGELEGAGFLKEVLEGVLEAVDGKVPVEGKKVEEGKAEQGKVEEVRY
ncbi:hypothetical protein HK097_006663, partial [Rhizophlyctis rosea]